MPEVPKVRPGCDELLCLWSVELSRMETSAQQQRSRTRGGILAMTTDRYLWLSLHPSTRRPTLCGCGQDLDDCSREHCPRCGAALVGDAVDPAAHVSVV
ncbi:hypothetical protein JCM18899A_41350 [Nocardioides sp. AN3]